MALTDYGKKNDYDYDNDNERWQQIALAPGGIPKYGFGLER